MNQLYKKFSSINVKLVIYVILTSTLFTIITTSINIYYEYRSEIDIQNNMISTLEASNSSLVELGIWNLDDELLGNSVNGITQLPIVISAKIYDQNDKIIVSKIKTINNPEIEEYSTTKRISIFKIMDDKKETIGLLDIRYTQYFLYQKIFRTISFFILTEFLKAFVFSFILLLIFKSNFSKNLLKISTFCSEQIENKIDYIKDIKLSRKESKFNDEFNLIENSMNKLIDTINSSREETQKELKLKEHALTRLSHLASFGEMAGNIGHEINNPLTIIKGSLYIIKKEVNKEGELNKEKILNTIGLIDKTSVRILKISNSISALARNNKDDDRCEVKLVDIIEEAISLIDEKMKTESIEFFWSIENPDITLYINRIQIGQVLFNLMNNAIFVVKNLSDVWIKLIVTNDQDNIMIKVIDSGLGISEEVRSNIFMPFYTTKKAGTGTGLGLSIVAKLVKAHNGEVYLDSSKGNTTFCIKLPIRNLDKKKMHV
jgi:signal transduction histidine kinase